MSGTVKAKLSLDPASYKQFKAQLKELERAARKEVIEEALTAGGTVIHDAASSLAPGPGVVLEIVGGRSLRKRVDPKMANVVKSNGKFAAIGPDRKHWYFRFFEFGAKKHNISAKGTALRFEGRDGEIFAANAKNTGGVPLKPFLRPAVDGQGAKAVREMGAVLKREIEKAAKG
jgi:HK97 gp10 family phage protein